MRVLDLSYQLSPDMPVYPGTEPPSMDQATTIVHDGFAEKLLTLYSHTGTHVDAPAHMIEGGPTLDSLGAGAFVGPGLVIDCSVPGPIVLSKLRSREVEIARVEFLLFRTLWSRFWGAPGYFEGFPVLEPEAARWLAGLSLKGLGFDAISADPVGSDSFENHLTLFRAGMVIVENLTGLDRLDSGNFLFSCLPLSIAGGDGSPVRAVALVAE